MNVFKKVTERLFMVTIAILTKALSGYNKTVKHLIALARLLNKEDLYFRRILL